MTAKLGDFSKTLSGNILKPFYDVYVNIDATTATEFWQPCFSKFAFFSVKGFISIFTNWIIILHLI